MNIGSGQRPIPAGPGALISRRRLLARAAGILVIFMLAACSGALADNPQGTFSIVAYDPATGELGVAVQSRVFGVGPRVAWVRAGAGAVATQANSNETFGPRGLALMAEGLSAEETLAALLSQDEGRDQRQVGMVDAQGRAAAWTGPGCSDWAGDSTGVHFSCQGNLLANAEVVAGMFRAFGESEGQELALRLLAALDAAQAAGGDRRGQQSAALLVGRHHPDYPEYDSRYVNLRVDDHATPIAELRRLYGIYEAQGLVQAHLRFATWQESRGDSAAARRERDRVGEVLVRVLGADCEDAGMLNGLAVFTAIHDIYLPQALEAAQRAAALEPEDSNILDTLAETQYRQGKVADAIETESRALELSPGDAYLEEQLARFRAGRP